MEQKNKKGNKPTIVVMRFSALGDIAMTIPVVYGVCEANSDMNFVYVTKKAVTGVFQNIPPNLTVKGIDLKEDYKGIAGMIKLWREMRREYNITGVADLHSVLRTYAFDAAARISGVKVVCVDKKRKLRQELVSRGAEKCRTPLPSMPELYAEVFNKLGLKPGDDFKLWKLPLEGEIKKMPGEKWIGIAPFAAHRGKIYPLEKMRTLIEQLSKREGTRLFLFGGGGYESELLAKWEEDPGGFTNLSGKKLGFAKELEIIGECDVMVSMDSANMHLASLCGTPVVSIWGSTHSSAGFGGRGQKEEWKVEKALPCRPCSVFGNKVCRFNTYECLTSIEPEEIMDKIDTVIG